MLPGAAAISLFSAVWFLPEQVFFFAPRSALFIFVFVTKF